VPHCPLCFTQATAAEIEAARTQFDVEDIESAAIEGVAGETGRRAMTTITFAIAETT